MPWKSDMPVRRSLLSAWWPLLGLAVYWVAAIWIVDPWGPVLANDDFSFYRCLNALTTQGKIIATGWGKGGPALIVHLLWSRLFTFIFGWSFDVVRISVLTWGVIGSVAVLLLLRRLKAPAWLALLGALVLAANPLYFSLSFTYMTDVTFAGLCVCSLWSLQAGGVRRSWLLVSFGLILAAMATLTRQIGIVIPMAFIILTLFRPGAREMGRWKLVLAALILSFLPWIGWEFALGAMGSTPVTRHSVFQNIVGHWIEKGPADYLVFVYTRLFHAALGYSGFFLLPLLVFWYQKFLMMPWVRRVFYAITVAFIVLETAILSGVIDPPVVFYQNVITNFGIGPLLFRDTYLMGIQRLSPLHPAAYYTLAYLAVLGGLSLLAVGLKAIRDFFQLNFIAALSLLCTVFYLGIITLAGFHDRYLIPVVLFLIIFLVGLMKDEVPWPPALPAVTASFILLIATAWFSIAGTHDYLALRKAAFKAHEFTIKELGADVCRVDGGFEINGYYCYDPDYQQRNDLSWWWVDADDYLLTMGPLPGYNVIKVFPVRRHLGKDGGVFVMKSESNQSP
jgi:4-amino-4-deoxy-L-arabinose transferase-like glycosyltransferase